MPNEIILYNDNWYLSVTQISLIEGDLWCHVDKKFNRGVAFSSGGLGIM